MKFFFIAILLVVFLSPTHGDEATDLQSGIDYRKKRIVKLQSEIEELESEISGYDKTLSSVETDNSDESGDDNEDASESSGQPETYSATLKRALSLEFQLIGQSAILERMKSSFIERLPFKKGESLGEFTDVHGTKYKNAVVSDVNSSGVSIIHSNGIAKLNSSDFPEGFRENLNRRPVTEDVSELVETTIKQRPSSVMKSATFSKRRSEVAKERAARLAAAPQRSNQTDLASSGSSDPSDWELERQAKAAEITAHNQNITDTIARLESRRSKFESELAQVEAKFQKDTMEYDSKRIVKSASALRKEQQRRTDIVVDYEDDKVRLTEAISDLDREIIKLTLQKKREMTSTAPKMSGDEKVKKAAELRAQIGEMEKKLRETVDLLAKMEDERAETARVFHRAKIKSDRGKFEDSMERYNSEIVRLTALTEAMKAKIREVQNSIPHL
ncbi:MAG: hypothetical protein P1U89_01085 [Verrucomicrobiales bacterium]|nr:hypothetical protein [Verrucomicrobiales bacterium]